MQEAEIRRLNLRGEKMSNQKLRSPIKWLGGKFHMRNKLLPLIPKHRTYVEVFGGGAQLLFTKVIAESLVLIGRG